MNPMKLKVRFKINASFKQNIMNKIQVSRNRENHVEQEISNNLAEIGKVEKQKEKILEKKFNKIRKENSLELKKENFFKPKNSFFPFDSGTIIAINKQERGGYGCNKE